MRLCAVLQPFPYHPPLFIRQAPSSRRFEKFVNFFLRRVTCPRTRVCEKVLIKTCRVSIRIDVTLLLFLYLVPSLLPSSNPPFPRSPLTCTCSPTTRTFSTATRRDSKKFPIRRQRVQITRTPVMKCK